MRILRRRHESIEWFYRPLERIHLQNLDGTLVKYLPSQVKKRWI